MKAQELDMLIFFLRHDGHMLYTLEGQDELERFESVYSQHYPKNEFAKAVNEDKRAVAPVVKAYERLREVYKSLQKEHERLL